MSTVGTFCLVLHSHLPWVAHHGRWPVGEEWLYQAWVQSYLPLVRVLRKLGASGHSDVLTLGVTPVLAAQLDDPHCLRGAAEWAADWSLRAQQLASRPEPQVRTLASEEFVSASAALDELATTWRHGGSPVLRGLADDGVVELLGGPATHSFLPLLDAAVAETALEVGLEDHLRRFGAVPQGIWAPECGHSPGLENLYARAGVRHLVLDEATVAATGRHVHAGWRMGDTDVVAVGRDLEVTNRIWSSRSGYPAGAHYRDFHAVDRGSGVRLSAVTGPDAEKRWYDNDAAAAAVRHDVDDFVSAVRQRLLSVAGNDRPPLVVAAYDTELFGHWWHEGPAFLEAVLRAMPEAGVRVTTLSKALGDDALVAGRLDAGPGSWGAGKDFSVWAGEPVRPMADEAFWLQRRLLDTLAAERLDVSRPGRRAELDQLLREALLTLSSDWAFMVTRDSAADYAAERERGHRVAFHTLAELVAAGRRDEALTEAAGQRAVDGPFGWLDARAVRASRP